MNQRATARGGRKPPCCVLRAHSIRTRHAKTICSGKREGRLTIPPGRARTVEIKAAVLGVHLGVRELCARDVAGRLDEQREEEDPAAAAEVGGRDPDPQPRPETFTRAGASCTGGM